MSWRDLWDPLTPLAREAEAATRQASTTLAARRLQLLERFTHFQSGSRRGVFAGLGLDLKGIRVYQPGDDVRKMDWNVLARTHVPHVKEHYEERRIPVWFWVDATAPMQFGHHQSKLDYARDLVSMLGLLALAEGHSVGLILWTGSAMPRVIAPQSHEAHLQHLLETISQSADNLTPAQEIPDLPRLIQQRSLVFFLSDFTFLSRIPHATGMLARLHARHAVHYWLLIDPVEARLPEKAGWVSLKDMAGVTNLALQLNERQCTAYQTQFESHLRQVRDTLQNVGRFKTIETRQPALEVITQWVSAA